MGRWEDGEPLKKGDQDFKRGARVGAGVGGGAGPENLVARVLDSQPKRSWVRIPVHPVYPETLINSASWSVPLDKGVFRGKTPKRYGV